jgi:hypothetical protein
LGEELDPNCSPKGELSAKLTEGVNGRSAAPLQVPTYSARECLPSASRK